MKNTRVLLLATGFLVSVAAGAWMVKTKLSKSNPPPAAEPSSSVAASNPQSALPGPQPSPARLAANPSSASSEPASLPKPLRGPLSSKPESFSSSSVSATDSVIKAKLEAGGSGAATPPVAGATRGDFRRVLYVDRQNQPVSMNEKELRDLEEPEAGPYDRPAVDAFVQRLKRTGKYRGVRDLGLQSNAAGQDQDLVIELDPEYLLTYSETPVTELLDIYSDLKGVNLIRDSTITSATKLTVTSKWPLSRDEAIKLMETTFLLNGLYLVAAEDHSVKVLPNTKDPKKEGIAIVRNLDDLIGGEVISSFVLKLKWIDPESAKNILIESFGNLHDYGKIVPVPSVGELVITENSELIRRMKELLDVVDRPPAEVKRTFVKLNQANADRVAELITQILESAKRHLKAGFLRRRGEALVLVLRQRPAPRW